MGLKVQVPILNKTLFIYHLQEWLHNSQYQKVIEGFYHSSLESHQALVNTPVVHNQLELALKTKRLQCLKRLVMFHSLNMEPNILSLSRKVYSEKYKDRYMINFAKKK